MNSRFLKLLVLCFWCACSEPKPKGVISKATAVDPLKEAASSLLSISGDYIDVSLSPNETIRENVGKIWWFSSQKKQEVISSLKKHYVKSSDAGILHKKAMSFDWKNFGFSQNKELSPKILFLCRYKEVEDLDSFQLRVIGLKSFTKPETVTQKDKYTYV